MKFGPLPAEARGEGGEVLVVCTVTPSVSSFLFFCFHDVDLLSYELWNSRQNVPGNQALA